MKVLVETRAGEGSAITGPRVHARRRGHRANAAEVWRKADLVVKVKEPQPSEYGYFRPGLILFTYLHLAPLPELTDQLLEAKVNGVAYETIREADGSLPLLTPMSEVAGRMAVQVGAQYLEAPNGGRGILLGGVPGVAPANVVILGGGVVGTNAAKIAVGMGAHVTIIDRNLNRLRELDDIFNSQVVTLASNIWTISETLELGGPGDRRGADSRRLRAQDGAPPDDRRHEARLRDCGRGHRSGRLLRNVARHHPHRSRLFCRWRAALLRLQHARGGAAHLHLCADQRDVPVFAGTGQPGSGARVREHPALREGVNTYNGYVTHSRRGRIPRPRSGKNWPEFCSGAGPRPAEAEPPATPKFKVFLRRSVRGLPSGRGLAAHPRPLRAGRNCLGIHPETIAPYPSLSIDRCLRELHIITPTEPHPRGLGRRRPPARLSPFTW